MLDVELTNACNFRCLMCKTGTGDISRKTGFMSEATFTKLLDDIGSRGTPLRFIRWGEPTLHPHWIQFMERAKLAGCLVHFNTNGSRLDEHALREVLRIGVDSVKFSFQGVDRESYREMRNIDYFDALMEIIARLHTLRGEGSSPFIQIATTVTDEPSARVERFRQLAGGICDYVSVGETLLDFIDKDAAGLSDSERARLQTLKARQIITKPHPHCPEVFGKLSVNWDGTVSACCNDYDNLMLVGDLADQTLHEIWNSKRLAGYRNVLARMEHHRLPLCRHCYI
jgi:MoaA/NifB/PqqE/SkfB family radical SAM enzyme